MLKHPPKDINAIYGYRTLMSMKNMDTWCFAHKYCGRLWWKAGWIMLALSVVVKMLFLQGNEEAVSVTSGIICTVQGVLLVATILPVERVLKENFNQDGTKK